jgi:hypothetical protein
MPAMASASRHSALQLHSSESLEQISIRCLKSYPQRHRLLRLCHQILFERIDPADVPSWAAEIEPRL